MSFLRQLKSFIGMFQRLFGMLMSGLMIFFPVVRGGNTVRVRGEFVELSCSLVRVTWHCFSLLRFLHLKAISHLQTLHLRTRAPRIGLYNGTIHQPATNEETKETACNPRVDQALMQGTGQFAWRATGNHIAACG
jgi:hypothetical protein